jgi:hypothetical protein
MANTPERYDNHEDGMEIAKDGDFVSYDNYAALLTRAEQAEADADSWMNRAIHQNEVANAAIERAKRAEARVKELEAERKEDHKSINIKADFIETMIGQSSDDHFELKRLRELLSDDLYDSKDWRSADLEGRITWLITMLANKNEEIDIWVKMINTDATAAREERERKVWNEALEAAAKVVSGWMAGRFARDIPAEIRAMKKEPKP